MLPMSDDDNNVWVSALFKKANGQYSPLGVSELLLKRGTVTKIESLLDNSLDDHQIGRIETWASFCPATSANMACIKATHLANVVKVVERNKAKRTVQKRPLEEGGSSSAAAPIVACMQQRGGSGGGVWE